MAERPYSHPFTDIERAGALVDDARMTVLRVALGAELRSRRKRLGLLMQDVCDDAGISRSTLSRIELGKESTTPGTLVRICAVLRTTAATVLKAVDGLCTTAPKTALPGEHGSLERQFALIDAIAADIVANPEVHGE